MTNESLAQTAQRWRSVEAEKPPKEGTILVVLYGDQYATVFYCTLERKWLFDLERLEASADFTHWMPLLAPPVVL